MSLVKSKAFKDLEKTIKIGQEIKSIDTMIKFLKKRKTRLLKRLGIDDGMGNSWNNCNINVFNIHFDF